MAKRPPSAEAAAEEELVVTVVRFKGSGETARKGIDAISQALSAAFGGGTTVVRHVNGRKAAALPAAPADGIDTEAVEETDDDAGDVEEQEAAAPAAKRERAPVKPPKFDSKLKVVPFKAVAAERNPQSMDEKYLVACLWLQEDSGLPTYGGSQILTCFRTMGWTEYGDFTQPLRMMKRDKGYFDQTVPRGQWKLTDNGLDVARQIKNPAKA